jgi:Smg protein
MNERLVEILIYLMQELHQNRRKWDQIDGISKELQELGYTENEINAAFSWLFERMEAQKGKSLMPEAEPNDQSFRVLHEVEKMVLTPAAYGYLLQLRQLGLINQTEMEQIIERAMMLGAAPVDVMDIRSIVASVIFDADDSDFQHFGKAMFDTDGTVH